MTVARNAAACLVFWVQLLPLGPAAAAAPAGAGSATPVTGADEALQARNWRLRNAEEELRSLRRDQAASLERLLELSTQDEERVSILFALAGLYGEGAELAEQAASTWVDEQARSGDPEERSRLAQRMAALRAEAEACRSRALAALQQVGGPGSTPAVIAEAASRRAALLQMQGQQELAAQEYRRAWEAAPASEQGRDAALHLGNEALDAGRLAEAMGYFQRVLEHGSPARDDLPSLLARWGLGSCELRQRQLPAAVATFAALLETLAHVRPGSPLEQRVRSTYLRALAETSPFPEALGQLGQLWGEQAAQQQLPALAEAYQSLPRHVDALLAWQQLLQQGGSPEEELYWRWRIVQDLAALAREAEALAALPVALSRLEAAASARDADPAMAVLESRDLAEKEAATLLLAQVPRAVAAGPDGEPAARELAGLLGRYLALFPGSARRWPLQVGLGALHYRLGAYLEGVEQHEQVLLAAEAPDALRQEAGLRAVLALGQVLQEPQPGVEPARIATRLLEVAERWAKLPGVAAGEAGLVRLDRARALGVLGREEQALAELEPVVAGGGEHAVQAARLSLDLQYRRQAWPELAAQARRYLADAALGASAGDFRSRLGEILCEAAYRAAWKQEAGDQPPQDDPDLAPRLEAYAAGQPACPQVPVALLAAGRLFQEAGRPGEARRVFERLLALQPAAAASGKEGQAPADALLRLGAACESMADLHCAAQAYERAGPLLQDCPTRSSLARRTFPLLQALGEQERAWSLLERALAACPGEAALAALPFVAGVAMLDEGRPAAAERAFGIWQTLPRKADEEELAVGLYREAIDFCRGKVDDLELERLVLEQQSTSGAGEVSGRAAARAATALVAAASARLEPLGRRLASEQRVEDLEELARLSRLLDGWARNIASWSLAGLEPELGVEALVRAGEGLQQAAAALQAAGQTALLGDADRQLAPWLNELGLHLLAQAREIAAPPTPWLLRARLGSSAPLPQLWRGLLPRMMPHLLPPAGAALPLAGIPWQADCLPGGGNGQP